MANQIIIDIGAMANDGTGDPLRTAFGYVNQNFSNVWATGVANSNIQFSGNRILTVNTNGNLVLAPNGTGKVVANVDIVPNANNTVSLGSSTLKWNTVYTRNLDVDANVIIGGNIDLTGDLTVEGNLTVNGTTTTINTANVDIEDKVITIAYGSPNAAVANGSGITVAGADANIIWTTAQGWTMNDDLVVAGNITGANITAPGTNQDVIFNRNGVLSTAAGFNYNYPGNILYAPAAGFSGDLSVGVNGLFVGLGTFTPLGSDIIGQFTANVNAYSQINTQNINSGPAASGDYIITADNGSDTTHFINMGITSSTWDGSQPNSLGNRLEPNDGYLYVQDGNLTLGVSNGGTSTWSFDNTGNLTLPGNTFAVNYANGVQVNIASYGNANVANYLPTYSGALSGNSLTITQSGNIWTIDGQRLTAPSGGAWFSDAANNDEYITTGADGYLTILSLYANTAAASEIQLQHEQTKIIVRDGIDQEWVFDLDGVLTVPGNIIPNTSNAYSLGSATNQWADLWVSNSTIYMNSVPITLGAGNVLTVNGEPVLTNDSNTSITTTGNITADYFIGDGSQLSNVASTGNIAITGTDIAIAAGAPETQITISPDPEGDAFIQIPNNATANTANLRVVNETGNVTIETDTGNNIWTFDNAGTLTAPGGIEMGTGDTGVQLRSNSTATGFYDTITNITNGSNTVIVTLTDVEFVEGDQGTVRITGVEGETEANGFWGWQAVEVDQIQLYTDGTLSTPVDGTTWSAYVSGGLAVSSGYNNLDIQGGSVAIISGAGKYWAFNPEGTTLYPTLTVTRGDRTGTLTGQALIFGDSTQEALISTPNGTNDINSSQRFVINPGAGAAGTTGEGGDIYLYAGRGGDAGGSGGDIKIRGGLGPVNGDGGYVDIVGGEADGTGTGGYIELRGGQSASAAGGVVRIQGGQGLNGAEANLVGGTGSAGSGGAVNITGGTSSNGLAEYGNVNITSGASTWTFNNTGNLVLPQGGIINEGPSPSFLGDAVTITPANGSDADQQLKIYPTIAEGNHLHLTTGNLYNTEMYVGDDNLYVKLANTGDVVINSNDGQGNTAQWTFGVTGNLTAPGNIDTTGNITAGNFVGSGSNVDIVAGSYDWTFVNDGNLVLPGNTFAVKYANGTAVNLGGNYGDSNVVTLLSSFGSNAVSTTGNVTANIISATNNGTGTNFKVGDDMWLGDVNVADTMSLRGQQNAANAYLLFGNADTTSSLGRSGSGPLTYNGAFAANTITLSGTGTAVNASGGNILTNKVTGTQFAFLNGIYTATLTGGGATSNYTLNLPANVGTNGQSLTSDGTGNLVWTTPASSYGNANVATFLANYGSNTISTTGNITAGNLIGNISITGNVTGTSANVDLVAGAYTWTFNNTGNLVLPGNTFAVNYANGTAVSLGGGSYGNANVADFLDSLGSNAIVTTGNITGGNLISSATIFGNPDIILGNIANASATKTRMVTDSTFSYIQTGNGTVGSTGNIVFSPYSSAAQRVVIDTSNGNLTVAGNATVNGTSSNLIRRAYIIAAANTAVTLDNIEARVGGSPTRLYINTVSGNLTGAGQSQTLLSGSTAVSSWVNVPIGQGAANAFPMSGALTSNGDTAILSLIDQGSGTGMWRITGMIANTSSNLYGVTIERLV